MSLLCLVLKEGLGMLSVWWEAGWHQCSFWEVASPAEVVFGVGAAGVCVVMSCYLPQIIDADKLGWNLCDNAGCWWMPMSISLTPHPLHSDTHLAQTHTGYELFSAGHKRSSLPAQRHQLSCNRARLRGQEGTGGVEDGGDGDGGQGSEKTPAEGERIWDSNNEAGLRRRTENVKVGEKRRWGRGVKRWLARRRTWKNKRSVWLSVLSFSCDAKSLRRCLALSLQL